MEVTNPDLKTISAISLDQKVEEINKDAQRIIYAVPGVSPMKPPKKRKRSQYNAIQLKEAVELAAVVGVAKASERSGVKPSSIYKFAEQSGRTITHMRGRATVMPQRKYAASLLREAFNVGMEWHKNTEVGLRTCIYRAAQKYRINENYLWSLYCSKDPVLGFGGAQ